MTYENYKIGAEGLYQSEKVPTEGYEAKPYGEGKTTYIKKFPYGIEGVITGFGTKEIEFEGRKIKMLETTLQEGDIQRKISTPLKNSKGTNYSDASVAMLSAMNGYKLGEQAKVNAYKKSSTGKNGKVYDNLHVSINHVNIKDANDKSEWAGFISFADIPKATSKEVAGETQWDFTPVMEFWYGKLQEITARFEGAPKAEAPKKEETKPVETNSSELPF